MLFHTPEEEEDLRNAHRVTRALDFHAPPTFTKVVNMHDTLGLQISPRI